MRGIAATIVFVLAVSTASGAEPVSMGPEAERWFVETVTSAANSYDAGSNDMAKGAIRRERARAMCGTDAPMKPTKGHVHDWVGTVETLNAVSDGSGVLAVRISEHVVLTTNNNELSEALGSATLISVGSALHKVAVNLSLGQRVRFSGSFFPSKVDCAQELSITASGGIHDPEFLFRFTALQPAP